jgi:aspartyl/asparaginyl beta-hydroxylase (cupin superfamily)
MRAALDHARVVVDVNGRQLADHLAAALAEARAKHAGVLQHRFDDALDVRLGRKKVYVQQPTGLHIPYLPAIQFYDRADHEWTRELEAATPEILAELQAVLAAGGGFVPYVAYEPGTPLNQWAELNHSKRWSTYFLWDQGKRVDAHCAACPRTSALIDRMPLADVPGRGPTAFFSMLAPRTRIPPHSGVTNSRLIVHLPLIVPDGCGFRVGNETRTWTVGESFMFDDTIEHEAWNDSDSPRFVLIVDTWNVFLTDAERDLVRATMQGLDSYYGSFSPLAGDA